MFNIHSVFPNCAIYWFFDVQFIPAVHLFDMVPLKGTRMGILHQQEDIDQVGIPIPHLGQCLALNENTLYHYYVQDIQVQHNKIVGYLK